MHPVQVPWTTVTNPHPARPTVPTVWFALFFTSCLESSQEACFLDIHMWPWEDGGRTCWLGCSGTVPWLGALSCCCDRALDKSGFRTRGLILAQGLRAQCVVVGQSRLQELEATRHLASNSQ